MVFNFDDFEVQLANGLKGGEGDALVRSFSDDLNAVKKITLRPGSYLGLHTHEGTSEIALVLDGKGEVLEDGEHKPLRQGDVVYCPEGCAHSIRNTSDADLLLFCVIPAQKAEK